MKKKHKQNSQTELKLSWKTLGPRPLSVRHAIAQLCAIHQWGVVWRNNFPFPWKWRGKCEMWNYFLFRFKSSDKSEDGYVMDNKGWKERELVFKNCIKTPAHCKRNLHDKSAPSIQNVKLRSCKTQNWKTKWYWTNINSQFQKLSYLWAILDQLTRATQGRSQKKIITETMSMVKIMTETMSVVKFSVLGI